MTDQFPALNLGECLGSPAVEFDAVVVTTPVTKGMVVDLTNVAGGIPKVLPAGAGSVIGGRYVVMSLGQDGTGAVGTKVRIGRGGIFKVVSGGSTAGKTQITAAAGTVVDGVTDGAIIGDAVQTMALADSGLVYIP